MLQIQPCPLMVHLARFVNLNLPAILKPAHSTPSTILQRQQVVLHLFKAEQDIISDIKSMPSLAWKKVQQLMPHKTFLTAVTAVAAASAGPAQQHDETQSVMLTRWNLLSNSFTRKLLMVRGNDLDYNMAHKAMQPSSDSSSSSFHPGHSSTAGYLSKVAAPGHTNIDGYLRQVGYQKP